MNTLRLLAATVVVGLGLSGCNTIAPFDQAAYDKTTGAKAEALALMDKATTPYANHMKEIDAVSLTVNKAYEYDAGRPLNAITLQQWQILRDPNRNLFGAFLRRWREKGTLKPDYVAEKKPDVAAAFDQITGLEIGKPRPN